MNLVLITGHLLYSTTAKGKYKNVFIILLCESQLDMVILLSFIFFVFLTVIILRPLMLSRKTILSYLSVVLRNLTLNYFLELFFYCYITRLIVSFKIPSGKYTFHFFISLCMNTLTVSN